MDRVVWNTLAQNQGQTVEVSEPQIVGAAEGTCPRGYEKLRLTFDYSDWGWSIYDGEKLLIKGNCHRQDVPSPGAAFRVALKKS